MNFSNNAKLLTFLIGFFMFSLFFVFEDAYSISYNRNIQVSLDKDQYTVGDEPIIEVTDTDKKDVVTVQLVTRVTTSTVPVTIATVQLVETDLNSGIFTGKSRPISEQDLVHSSGSPNKYLSASYTPVYRGQIYSSAYTDLKALPPPPTEPVYGSSGLYCPPTSSGYVYDPQGKPRESFGSYVNSFWCSYGKYENSYWTSGGSVSVNWQYHGNYDDIYHDYTCGTEKKVGFTTWIASDSVAAAAGYSNQIYYQPTTAFKSAALDLLLVVFFYKLVQNLRSLHNIVPIQ